MQKQRLGLESFALSLTDHSFFRFTHLAHVHQLPEDVIPNPEAKGLGAHG
jgi:hypothetical protein